MTAPNDELRNKMYRLRTIFEASVMSVDHAGNIVVVKTLPGLGNAAGEAIDSMDLSRQVGSLAGDNTVFVVMRDEDAAKSFTEDVKEML